MKFTIAGAFYVVVIFFLFLKNINDYKKNYIIMFTTLSTLDLFINVGYVVKIGNTKIEYLIFSSLILLCFSCFVILKNIHNLNMNPIKQLLICLCAIIISAFLSNSHTGVYGLSYNEFWDQRFWDRQDLSFVYFNMHQFIGMLGRFAIWFINLYAFSLIFSQKYLKTMNKQISSFLCLTVILYIVEFFMYNFAHNLEIREQLVTFLNGDVTSSYLSPRKVMGLYSPLLLLAEPSATTLLFLFLSLNELSIYNRDKKKSHLFNTILLIAFNLLSGSMGGLIYVAILLMLLPLILIKNKNVAFFVIIGSLMLCIAIALILFGDRANQIINYLSLFKLGISNLPATSEVIRMYSIYIALVNFAKYPLFGIGLGVSYAHSGFLTFLSNVGLIGAFLFFKIYKSLFFNFKFKNSSKIIGLFSLIAIYTFTGAILMFMYTPYSIIMYLLIITSLNEEKINVLLSKEIQAYVFSQNTLIIKN